jgi:integrase/recombinase XerD
MLERLFPKVHALYLASANGALLEDFADWLVSTGYAHRAASRHVRQLKQALGRMRSTPLTEGVSISASFLSQAFASRRARSQVRATRRVFERFLVARGRLIQVTDPGRFAPLLNDYRRHLSEVRGLTAVTVDQHIVIAKRFLAHALLPEASLGDLSAREVEQFVVAEGRRVQRQTLQHIVAHLRGFLRFCFNHEVLSKRLDTIDAPRVYRGELPPRALTWPLVQRLLRSIDRSTRLGWRDYAILHLMAHYGLRPSEIVTLTLGSIDWQAATMSVKQRKTRSDLVLPLAPRTMRVLSRYLHRGRPTGPCHELFVRGKTPTGPLTNGAVNELYQKRARESGLPLHGTSSYCLRHSFAMRLLDRGVGVKMIGDLLGHRNLESTCVYLRLQIGALRDVALPLPSPVIGIVEGAA